MIRISLAFLTLFIFNCFIFSQYQNVSIVSGYDANEPSISINPLNTNQVVAGVWKTYMGTDTSHSSYFYSTNGGLNWQGGPMLSTIVNPGGDPCVFTDADGNFYFLCLSNYYTPYFLDYLVCFKSTNGGANWNNGVLFAYTQDIG